MMTAKEKLIKKNNQLKFICVGLDSDLTKMPASLRHSSNPLLEFNKKIIDATSDLTAAYKFNLAFYESEGSKGLDALAESMKTIPSDILIIGDGKRGDIGNTSQKYAEMFFNQFEFDAATVNPYMGQDSIEPFLNYRSKLIFILTLTSNSGSTDFEKAMLANNKFLYQQVIKKVHDWNINSNCGIVYGATNEVDLINDIQLFGNLPVLLPGVGAQGGSLAKTAAVFAQNKNLNYLINVSRGIIYKSSFDDFAQQARNELLRLNEIVSSIMNS